jgi:hypothetical protein
MRARHGTNREVSATLSPQKRIAQLWETWRMAQARSELALNTWYAASKGDKARTYATYTAALEREGLVADLLAQAAGDGAIAAA